MLIQIIIWLITGAATALVIKKLIKKLKGEDIIALGPREAGKTTFQKTIRKLRTGESVERTKTIDLLPKSKTVLNNGKVINIKKGNDVPGGDDSDAKAHWKDIFNNCDICYYIFDASQIYPLKNKKYFEIMDYEIRTINEWIKENRNTGNSKKKIEIFIIGSKVDIIEGYKNMTDIEKQNIKDAIYIEISEFAKILKINLNRFFLTNLLDEKQATEIFIKSLEIIYL